MIKLNYPKFWNKVSFLTICLLPFSLLYLFLGFIRNRFTTKIYLPCKVICVGNISIGGTGKTQLVMWIAQTLKKYNISFVILTKGYLGKINHAVHINNSDYTVEDVGDESLLLSKFGDVISSKNPKNAISLIKKLDRSVVIMDDGMQNPAIHKDYKIVTIDTMRMNGNGFIFPAGPLRGLPQCSLKTVDAIVFIGSDKIDNNTEDKKNEKINKIEPLVNIINQYNIPYFYSKIHITIAINLQKQYIAFAAIGNPDKFFTSLKKCKVNLFDTKNFPDHYFYQKEDVDKIIQEAKANGCELLTTSKDFIKLEQLLAPEDKELITIVNTNLQVEQSHLLEDIIRNILNKKPLTTH